MYSVQRYVIKFVSDLRQVGGFSPGTPVSPTKKIDRHDIAEILLKVAFIIKNLSLSLTLYRINIYGKSNIGRPMSIAYFLSIINALVCSYRE